MKRTNQEEASSHTSHLKRPKTERETPLIDPQFLVHPQVLNPSMLQSRNCDLAVKAKVLKISAGDDRSTILHCMSPSSGFDRPLQFWVCILGPLPAGQSLQPTTSRFNISLKLMGASYTASSFPPFPQAGESTLAEVDQPSFKLVYDDTVEFRLTSNRNETKDIVRPRLGACISISISHCLHSSR